MVRATRVNPIGKQYGNWLVLKELPRVGIRRMFLCRCGKCQREKELSMGNFLYGNSTQCKSCAVKGQWARGYWGKTPKKVRSGNRTMTVRQWADILGVPEGTVRTRLASGNRIDMPVRSMGRNGKIRTLKYDGHIKNMAQWARLFGVSRERVRQLMDDKGLTIGQLVKRYGVKL